MNSFNYHIPTHALFGAGKLNELHKQILPGKKALIVISNGKSTRSNGYLARVEEQLSKAGVAYAVFDGVNPNPTKANVHAGAAAAKANACDFILALGGGSCMDAAKAIGGMATNEGDLWDYINFGTGKGKTLSKRPLPVVAITTTAGTGSETDAGGVITNEETHEKTAYFHPDAFPVLAIIDPELMTSVPPMFTAYQGFDALFHSVEGYVSKGVNLMSDMYAINAISSIGNYLSRAVKDGNDLVARTRVAWANYLSGLVMCTGLCTSEHSLEHALSAYHSELPHGAGLIMISKSYYTCMIEKRVCDERFVEMAKALGLSEAQYPIDFVTALNKLQQECGVADLKMSDYGINENEFEKMVKNARDTMGFLFDCDRVALSDEDCLNIYRRAYK